MRVLQWQQGLDAIRATGNKTLLQAVSAVRLTSAQKRKLRFYKVTYKYGDVIASNGNLDWSTIHVNNNSPLKNALAYAPIPLGLALDKTIEINSILYPASKAEYIPTTLIQKGDLFGVFQALNKITQVKSSVGSLSNSNSWNVAAGSQSVLINFPSRCHKQSKTAPDWNAVLEIIKADRIEWNCSVLFFPKELVGNGTNIQCLTSFLHDFGWVQNQLVLAFNSIFDNALDHLAHSCNANAKADFSHILFWFFVRVFLVASNVRPGYVLVDPHGKDAAGPFPEVLGQLGKAQQQKRNNGWTPMIFEPCFLKDAASPIYCSAYQATVVGGLAGKVKRSVNKMVTTPIEAIRGNLYRQLGLSWLAPDKFVLLEMKTRATSSPAGGGASAGSPAVVAVKHTNQIEPFCHSANIDPLTAIINPYDEPFAKVLVSIRKG
ncbi:MAG: hypothetical protein HY360_14630 [Verrucomicrobia bacterium]|nr:hypothetical protein [Verrucomicrobiota bacterium]